MSKARNKIRAELNRGAQEGQARLEYTRRAYRMLPELDQPRVLDVGCGRGGPTLELARLSGGQVTGLDVDGASLDVLAGRAREAGLAGRVHTLPGSMLEIDLPDASFDLVWSEGAIFVIGFARGLRQWRRLIQPGGFLVVHAMAWLEPDPPRECASRLGAMFPGLQGVPDHLAAIPGAGYELLHHFPLPEKVWWQDYYGPRQERIQALREAHAGDPGAQAVLDEAQAEVDLYRRCARWYGSAFYVMRRDEDR